jgi:lipoprotein-anchoring transpeptidase ErfK/SrfK
MGLASQSARSGSRRAYMSSRRRPRRPLWIWLVVIAAMMAAGWWWLGSSDDEPLPETVVTQPRKSTPEVLPEITFAPAPTSEKTPPSPPPTPRTSATPAKVAEPELPATPRPETTLARPEPVRNTTAITALERAAAVAANDPVTARGELTRAWLAGLDGIQRDNARRLSRRLADSTLLETPGRAATPYARPHRVLPNEVLGKIIRNENVEVNADFLARINGLRSPDNVRQGRDLWLPNGRFHAVVDLSDRDLAVFQEMDGRRDLLVVMPVGVGVDGLTPPGLFRVKPGSKSSNPSWTDPATGRHWKSDDTGNPIGEHWIGLEALEESARANPAYRSLGLHGTAQPETVGTACTNGSLRLLGDDVELLFQILGSGTSTVEIRE